MLWLLEELGADYRMATVRYPEADGSGADPRNPHPHGYTPALDDDGQIVTETGAITLYLTDLFPGPSVGVAAGQPLRARYLSWLFYQVGLTEPLLYTRGHQTSALDAAPAWPTNAHAADPRRGRQARGGRWSLSPLPLRRFQFFFMKPHCCPVKSRTNSIGWRCQASRIGSCRPARRMKAGFSRKPRPTRSVDMCRARHRVEAPS